MRQVATSTNSFLTTDLRTAMAPIASVPRERVLPLSFAQERLWRSDQLQPRNCQYNLLNHLRLSGPLNLTALEATLTEIVRRHEMLRSTFETVAGQPVQAIHHAYPLQPELIDVSDLSGDEQEIEVSRLTAIEAQRPFDLERGPLLRVTLLRLAQEDHIALFTMHHIISDAWSIGVFVREMAILYAAFSNGRPSPLPELQIQYGDYAVRQRSSLTPELIEEQVVYWRECLDGAAPVLKLRNARSRPVVQAHHGSRYPVVIPADLAQSLRELSLLEGTTMFMTLLAVFQALLSFYSEHDDISIGAPIANRSRRETEALIGCFANPAVMRTDLSGDPTFRELLRRVKETCLGAYAHHHLPFEKLVEELQIPRRQNFSPLFQVMFVLDHAPAKAPSLPGLRIESLDTHNGMALFDLSLCLVDKGSEIRGSLEFDLDLFDVKTIDRFVDHFLKLIRSIAGDASQPLSALRLYNASPAIVTSKINRQALPAMRPSENPYVAPSTQTERKILSIWQKALGTLDIGVEDNFFDVGGNSFLLVKIHNTLRETVQTDLSLMDLFEYPTVRSLVQHIDRRVSVQTSFQPVYERVSKAKEAFLKRKIRVEERQALNV